jgi:glutamine synthetase
MGIDILTVNCEYAPAQVELTYAPRGGLGGSDAAYSVKNGIKEIAQSMGLLATFMSKPFANQAGCGCHYHCSLVDKEKGKNAFADESSEDGLSLTCRHFVGGLLRHLRSIASLLAPTLNCYKRYRPHTFAPINVSWGFEDRTAAIRIKAGKGESVHIENRVPSGSSNPYLTAAGTLAAGLLGIQNRIEPMPTSLQMADSLAGAALLPADLPESLDCLLADEEICGILGSEFIKLFTAVKRYELNKFNDAVTDFERQEYLEFL